MNTEFGAAQMFYVIDDIDDDTKRDLLSDSLEYNLTEDLLVKMQERGETFDTLGYKLDIPPDVIEGMLTGNQECGSGSLSLSTISDICYAMGVRVKITLEDY